MIIDNNMKKYLSGEYFDDGRYFDFSANFKGGGNKNNEVFDTRIEAILKYSLGKTIIHLGAADHIELIDKKIKENIWLHDLICKSSKDVIGFDINEEAVTYINSLGWSNIYCVDMVNDAAHAKKLLAAQKKKWDYLLAGEILEHINNPVEFLSQLNENYRNCVKYIIITVPNAFRISNIKSTLQGMEGINTDHKYWFTPFTLCKVAAEAGMSPERLIYAGKAQGKTKLLLKFFNKNICYDDLILIAKFL